MTLEAAAFPACTFTKAAGVNAITALIGQVRLHCNLDRKAWVSIDTLAEETGFHRSTMSRAGDRLHGLGVLEKRHVERYWRGKLRKCCEYRILPEHWRGPQNPRETAFRCKNAPKGEASRILREEIPSSSSETPNRAREGENEENHKGTNPNGAHEAPLAGIKPESPDKPIVRPIAPTTRQQFQPIRHTVAPLVETKGSALKAKIRNQLIQKLARYLAARGRPEEVAAYWAAMMGSDQAAAQRMLDATDRRMRIERWDDMRDWPARVGVMAAAYGDSLTTHGIRSSLTDWATEQTNFPAEVREMALAHIVGDKFESAY